MENLQYKVFAAARDGMAITMFAILCNKANEEVHSLLAALIEESGQKTSPLVIAARNGHEKVVKMLLSNFTIDIEQIGTVKFDGFTIEGATALWSASGAGHFDVVKCLLDAGASVNHPTLSNSTPLRAACFDGRLDIVNHLVEQGADIHIPNKYNNTCLMIACYKGHTDVVKFLLEQGADANAKAQCGATALHFSAERGHTNIVKYLVAYGAKMLKNDQGMTPLFIAAESSQAEIVEFLIFEVKCDLVEQIDALELLGASYATDKDSYDIEKCYAYLLLAMQHRLRGSIKKKLVPCPVAAYGNRVECQTLKELELLKDNHDALHIECLIIRERILGEDNMEIPHAIIFRGAVFADTARFDRCTDLWIRALMLRQRNNRPCAKDLLRFTQVFSQMLHIGVAVHITMAESVFQFMLEELPRDEKRLALAESKEDQDVALELLEMNIHTALYLLVILCKLRKGKDEEFRVCKLAYQFNKLNLRLKTKDNYTPLHMVCDEESQVDDFHVNDIVQFPNDVIVRLLVQCGADVNTVDSNGNLPLHIIVHYNNPISNFLTLHNIIMTLIEGGCHLDQTNTKGETPTDASTTGVAEIIIRTRRNISLKCLAAKAVKQHHLSYVGQIPVHLEEFVAVH